MKNVVKTYFILPLLLYLVIALDGVLTLYFKPMFQTDTFQMVFQVTYIFIMAMTLFLPERQTVLWAMTFGVVYDAYYGTIISFYAVPLTITIYILRAVLKQFEINFLVSVGTIFMGILFINLLQYPMAFVLRMPMPIFSNYFIIKVVPTTLLNTCIMAILYPVFKRLMGHLKKEISY